MIVVRHGQTDSNASGLLLGRADPSLNDVGRAQAAAIGRFLDAHQLIDASTRFVTSPLVRARETLSIVASCVPSAGSVEIDERWIELDYGDYDQQPIGSVPPEVWDRWRSDLDFVPPGGESLRALGTRVRSACASLVPLARDGTVVVATHVSPVKAAVAWALSAPDEQVWRMFVAPGSVTRIAVRDDPVLVSFNEQPPPI